MWSKPAQSVLIIISKGEVVCLHALKTYEGGEGYIAAFSLNLGVGWERAVHTPATLSPKKMSLARFESEAG